MWLDRFQLDEHLDIFIFVVLLVIYYYKQLFTTKS